MSNIVVAGCGFVGLGVARTFQKRGWTVNGLTLSRDSALELGAGEAFPVTACDISSPEAVSKFSDTLPSAPDVVLHCASSGKGGGDAYRRVYLGGVRNLMISFPKAQLLFTSSTSVYPQTNGDWVTELSSAEPPGELGQILREAEDEVLAKQGIVARLAGIYGPKRSVLLRKFLSGDAVIEDGGSRWINQIHRDDIVSALISLLELRASAVFNVCDDRPFQQREFYSALAEHYSLPLPPEGSRDPLRKRAWTSKRVSNAKLRALGWVPRFSSFLDALKCDPALLTGIKGSSFQVPP